MKSWIVILFLCLIMAFAWLIQFFWQPFDVNNIASSEERLGLSESRLERLKNRVSELEIAKVTPETREEDEVDQVLDWLQAGNLQAATDYVKANIADLTGQVDLVIKVATAIIRSGEYEEGLSLLYEYRLFVPFEAEGTLLEEIFNQVARIELALDERKEYQRLVDVYELLLAAHADHTPYYLRLAHWQLQQGLLANAEQTLAGARNDIDYQEEVAALLERMEVMAGDETAANSIPLIKKQDQFALELVLADEMTATLMIDTGASMTAIKTSVINLLSEDALEDRGELALNTANGLVLGRKVALNNVSMSEIILPETEIAVIPMENIQYDGLLGMNILSQFEFFIDQDNAVLYLK